MVSILNKCYIATQLCEKYVLCFNVSLLCKNIFIVLSNCCQLKFHLSVFQLSFLITCYCNGNKKWGFCNVRICLNIMVKMMNWKQFLLLTITCFIIGIWIFWIYAIYEQRSFSTLPFIVTTSFGGLLLSANQHLKTKDADRMKISQID